MSKQARDAEWYDTVYFHVKSTTPLLKALQHEQDFFFGWADWVINTRANTVYDVGGGNGRIGEALALRGWTGDYHLIDWSAFGLECAEERLANVPHGFSANFQQADITQYLPLGTLENACMTISGVFGWIDNEALLRLIPSGMLMRFNPAHTETNTTVWKSEAEVRKYFSPWVDIELITESVSYHQRGTKHPMWLVVGRRR